MFALAPHAHLTRAAPRQPPRVHSTQEDIRVVRVHAPRPQNRLEFDIGRALLPGAPLVSPSRKLASSVLLLFFADSVVRVRLPLAPAQALPSRRERVCIGTSGRGFGSKPPPLHMRGRSGFSVGMKALGMRIVVRVSTSRKGTDSESLMSVADAASGADDSSERTITGSVTFSATSSGVFPLAFSAARSSSSFFTFCATFSAS